MAKQKPARKSRKAGDRYNRLVIAGIVVSLVAIILIFWGPLKDLRKPAGKAR